MLCDLFLLYINHLYRVRKTCFQRGFEVFEENIFKEKSGASSPKSRTENLTSMIYESFLWELYFEFFFLALALYSYCGVKKQNTDFFRRTCFKELKNMVVEEKICG